MWHKVNFWVGYYWFDFFFPRLVTLPRLKNPVCSTYLPIAGFFFFFTKSISMKWNADNLIQDLNSCCQFLFLLLHSPYLIILYYESYPLIAQPSLHFSSCHLVASVTLSLCCHLCSYSLIRNDNVTTISCIHFTSYSLVTFFFITFSA